MSTCISRATPAADVPGTVAEGGGEGEVTANLAITSRGLADPDCAYCGHPFAAHQHCMCTCAIYAASDKEEAA